jgi:hypothetical protein
MTAPAGDELFRRFTHFAAGHGLEPVLSACGPVDAFYDATRKEFVMQNAGQRWLCHPPRQFAMILRTNGIPSAQTDSIMVNIINTRDVQYTGRLAGHPAGFYQSNGVRMLVTEGPSLPAPADGSWPTIGKLITGLLGSDREHGELQVHTFLYWMRSAYEAVSSGKWRPGQILALAGPPACGKSLLQRIITECIGGRAADAFRYLSGGTQFNRDLFEAEHLVIDDAQASTDFRTRMQTAAHLKALAVSRDHSCHGKGRDAVNLRPLWRCSISLNDEGECLLVLPPLRADIADKIHIFRCASPAEPFPTSSPELMASFWDKLVSEIPAFLKHCLGIEPPAGRIDARFGIRAFHHPALVSALEEQAPEVALLELIDQELWRDQTLSHWEGTARDLESALLASDSKVREQTRRLLTWSTACGTYLGRLAQQGDRVESVRDTQKRSWVIVKP